jgi:hypothetical protein
LLKIENINKRSMADELKFDELEMSIFSSIAPEAEEEEEQEEEVIVPPIEKNKPIEEETPEAVDGDDEGEEQDNPDTEEEEASSSQSALYSSLAMALKEEGLFPSLESEKDIKSVEDLIEAFQKEIKSNEFADLTETQKEYLQAVRAGVPHEEIKQHLTTSNQLSSITEEELAENEDLRKQLILQDFLIKGYSQEKANKLTQRSLDLGEDVSDAKEALDSIKEYDKVEFQKQVVEQQKIVETRRLQEEAQLQEFKKSVLETKEIIPGVSISPAMAQKVYEQATKIVDKTDSGAPVNALMKARITDPIGFETKLNYLFYLTKGFSDFSKIERSQKRKAIEELDNVIRGNTVLGEEISKKNISSFSHDIINNIK